MAKKISKEDQEIDYESLYYKAMKENTLLREKHITLDFKDDELYFLRNAMYEVLLDMKFDTSIDDLDEDQEEDKKIGRLNKNEFLSSIIDERRILVEGILKKITLRITLRV